MKIHKLRHDKLSLFKVTIQKAKQPKLVKNVLDITAHEGTSSKDKFADDSLKYQNETLKEEFETHNSDLRSVSELDFSVFEYPCKMEHFDEDWFEGPSIY